MNRQELEEFNQTFLSFINSYKALEKTQHFSSIDCTLSISEVHTVVDIAKNPDSNLLSLSIIQGISRSAVTQMITKLEKKELVEKQSSSNKKNEYKLVLTAKGKDVFKEHQFQQDYITNEILNVLNSYPSEAISYVESLMEEIKIIWESLPWL
ncbi:MarR family transcriptional regulator [Clostridium nigeriense]|uniref:MarR family transcriptional regulator n=1 Tax=Clostridium nigeriense TaxID=1805470 RepID=UPI003D344E72